MTNQVRGHLQPWLQVKSWDAMWNMLILNFQHILTKSRDLRSNQVNFTDPKFKYVSLPQLKIHPVEPQKDISVFILLNSNIILLVSPTKI